MKIFHKLFGWFFSLVRSISIKVKIFLLFFLPAIGIIAFFSFIFYDTNNYLSANTELTGMIKLSVEVSNVSHQLQIERGRTAGYMADRSIQKFKLMNSVQALMRLLQNLRKFYMKII